MWKMKVGSSNRVFTRGLRYTRLVHRLFSILHSMRWLAHSLRLPETSLLRSILMRGETPTPCSVLADSSMAEQAE